jgi:serine/threonine protein kinase, bacterial
MSLRNLDHPNLIRYQQIWCHTGYLIFSMELAECNLDDLFEAYQLELGTGIVPQHLCTLLTDAAHGIDYLNARDSRWGGSGKGLQHCDIKPSNLLLCQERVKVADFGMANSMVSSRDTQPLGGTLTFCAPEVFLGRVSSHTDQFALAVSYYQLRTGKFPFNDTPATMKEPCERLAPDLSLVTHKEQVILARALNPSPAKRWSSCTEFMSQMTCVVYAPDFASPPQSAQRTAR